MLLIMNEGCHFGVNNLIYPFNGPGYSDICFIELCLLKGDLKVIIKNSDSGRLLSDQICVLTQCLYCQMLNMGTKVETFINTDSHRNAVGTLNLVILVEGSSKVILGVSSRSNSFSDLLQASGIASSHKRICHPQ